MNKISLCKLIDDVLKRQVLCVMFGVVNEKRNFYGFIMDDTENCKLVKRYSLNNGEKVEIIYEQSPLT